ncbi:MAG TPA: hypothetical protein VF006_06720 [Longimicrobium sp.]
MKKLTLTLDDLRVDSFQTSEGRQEEGTVFGEQCTCQTNCTCPGCPTCDRTCPATCEYSCYNTCDQYTCAYQLDPPFGPWYPCIG